MSGESGYAIIWSRDEEIHKVYHHDDLIGVTKTYVDARELTIRHRIDQQRYRERIAGLRPIIAEGYGDW